MCCFALTADKGKPKQSLCSFYKVALAHSHCYIISALSWQFIKYLQKLIGWRRTLGGPISILRFTNDVVGHCLWIFKPCFGNLSPLSFKLYWDEIEFIGRDANKVSRGIKKCNFSIDLRPHINFWSEGGQGCLQYSFLRDSLPCRCKSCMFKTWLLYYKLSLKGIHNGKDGAPKAD